MRVLHAHMELYCSLDLATKLAFYTLHLSREHWSVLRQKECRTTLSVRMKVLGALSPHARKT